MSDVQKVMAVVEKEIAQLHPVQQINSLPRSVETTARNIENTFEQTARALEATASKLRERADDLDKKAVWLRSQAPLAEELRTAVATERSYWEEVISLALVDVGVRQE